MGLVTGTAFSLGHIAVWPPILYLRDCSSGAYICATHIYHVPSPESLMFNATVTSSITRAPDQTRNTRSNRGERMRTGRWILLIAMWAGTTPLEISGAQSRATVQDSTLNNLIHARDYRTAPPGGLGRVISHGSGPTDVLIIPGYGFGADVFEPFMRVNSARFHMIAVTLPGFGGTP